LIQLYKILISKIAQLELSDANLYFLEMLIYATWNISCIQFKAIYKGSRWYGSYNNFSKLAFCTRLQINPNPQSIN